MKYNKYPKIQGHTIPKVWQYYMIFLTFLTYYNKSVNVRYPPSPPLFLVYRQVWDPLKIPFSNFFCLKFSSRHELGSCYRNEEIIRHDELLNDWVYLWDIFSLHSFFLVNYNLNVWVADKLTEGFAPSGWNNHNIVSSSSNCDPRPW